MYFRTSFTFEGVSKVKYFRTFEGLASKAKYNVVATTTMVRKYGSTFVLPYFRTEVLSYFRTFVTPEIVEYDNYHSLRDMCATVHASLGLHVHVQQSYNVAIHVLYVYSTNKLFLLYSTRTWRGKRHVRFCRKTLPRQKREIISPEAAFARRNLAGISRE